MFQSTRPHGARLNVSFARVIVSSSFQSTRPHGARRRNQNEREVYKGFQSTRPHGARLNIAQDYIIKLMVSIHAPAWGATQERGSSSGG